MTQVRLAATAALLLTLVPVAGLGVAPDDSLQSLAAAERSFSALSVQHGMKTAFLTYLADDGVIFRPIPLNGKKSWQERKDPGGTLAWEPAYVEVSAAGDLGYDTGPWEFHPPSDPKQTIHGHFVSVWKRPPGTRWKVVVDLGVSHAKPDSNGLGHVQLVEGPLHEKMPSGGVEDLRKLDVAYSQATRDKDGIGAAFETVAAPDVRLNRDGFAPFVGVAAARAALDSLRGNLQYLTLGSALAVSRDLGYSYGIAQRFEPAEAAQRTAADSCVYLHVWRQGADKSWKLALEVLNPLPRTGRK